MKKILFCLLLLATSHSINAQFGSGGSQGGNGIPPGGSSGGNGNIAVPPRGPNVIVYRDMKYTGMSRALGTGTFGANELGFLGGNVSSIYIPPGMALRMYDNRGNTRTFTISVSNLAQYGWDNKMASGLIQRSNTGGGFQGGNGVVPRPPAPVAVAILFRNDGFSGGFITCGTGRIRSLGATGDRAVSSIQLARGYAIRVYSGLNLTGQYRTFTGSVISLAPYGWNDVIRSVQIIRL